jgi:hypothetical protein
MISDQHLYFNNKELTAEQKKMTFGQLKIRSGATLLLKVRSCSFSFIIRARPRARCLSLIIIENI